MWGGWPRCGGLDRLTDNLGSGETKMPERNIVLPQDEDCWLTISEIGGFKLRYASLRSSESREMGQANQDYLAVHVRESSISFAVCDGVSQSFFGEFAAKFLGQNLLDWLGEKMLKAVEPKVLIQDLYSFLTGVVNEATHAISGYGIDGELPALLHEVLEEKKRMGSEATFVCGRVDLPGEDFPRGRGVFSWLGNTRLRLGRDNVWGVMITKEPDKNRGRWSTRRGLISGRFSLASLEMAKGEAYRFNRVLVYTDGLCVLDGVTTRPSDEEMDRILKEVSDAQDGDDATLLEIEI